jgi:deoxyadenosine/deoxycytidine kinase
VSAPLDLYDDELPPQSQERGLYVAISGNTSGGKSTLVAAVTAAARAEGLPAVGVTERAFHHRYLRLMFSEPERMAFPLQLSFMLERHLVLLRNLELGRVVTIERSHLDDELFVREHHDAGRISHEQLDGYLAVARALHGSLPMPDVLVLLNPAPEVSLARLARAEARGERPREFPSERSKEQWVRRWHERYVAFHDELRERHRSDPLLAATELVELDGSASADTVTQQLLTDLRLRAWLRTPAT